MKYVYAYKTSDGLRHEDAMDASSREEVFAALRAKGIKAIKVTAADGSKANGEAGGGRTRAVAAFVPLAVAVVGVLAYLGGERTGAAIVADLETSSPRHQIYGDPAVVEAFGRGDFGDALPREGDRLLAIFAQPGKLMCAKDANPRSLAPASALLFDAYARDALAVRHDLALPQGDSREVRELKQIVNGMRAELRAYLANGNGTPRSYWRRLNERTAQEMRIFECARRELEGETDEAIWERKNDSLRRLGLRTIPNPNE